MAGLIVGFLISFVWAVLAPKTRLAEMLSDVPADDPLKVHRVPIPPIGGIGIFLGLHAGLLVEGSFDGRLLAVTVGALMLGLVDDRRGLAPILRLGAEALLGVGVAWPLFGSDPLMAMLVAGGTVVAINAVNLYDGLDGLVATTVAVTALGVWLMLGGEVALVLVGTLVGFAVRNWHPATLFLGDGGSYLIATVLAFSVGANALDLGETISGLALFGVVIVDLVLTVLRRARSRRPLFVGDRSHSYDQLVDRGWSVPRVAMLSATAQVVLVGPVVAAATNSHRLAVWVAMGLGLGAVGAAWRLGFLDPGSPGR